MTEILADRTLTLSEFNSFFEILEKLQNFADATVLRFGLHDGAPGPGDPALPERFVGDPSHPIMVEWLAEAIQHRERALSALKNGKRVVVRTTISIEG